MSWWRRCVLIVLGALGALWHGTTYAAPFAPELETLDRVPAVTLPDRRVRETLARTASSERPYRFAVPVALSLPSAQGQWTALAESHRWRLRIQSPGAQSLSVHFPAPNLPAGTELWVHDPQGRVVHGPYGPDRITPSGLWIPLVSGNELVLEARLPAGSAESFALGTAQVFHGYRSWKSTADPKVSGACNIDVTCAEAQEWSQDAQSVARITIGNQFFCSGQLLNNVQQDKRRLFLTANHCGIDGAAGPADSVNFYFNYVGTCGDGQTEPAPPPDLSGADLLASDVQSDFALLLITDTRPLPENAYFAGWDATGAGSTSGVSIHHPSGDEKKISFYDSDAIQESVNIGAACAVDAWRVQWRTNGGTTEGGSSGGGLWNAAHQLIGQLSGGTASCMNPTGYEYFGRLDRAWTANPRPDGQLKVHLDPNNTCIAEVPGLAAAERDPVPFQAGDPGRRHRCQGTPSTCAAGNGGGGAPLFLPLMTLALLLRIRSRSRR